MEEIMTNKYKHKILTLPNLLSLFRLLLIPCFVFTYTIMLDDGLTAMIIFLSGLTDIADGFIARHFNMVSDFGKILDPIADKLTQTFMLFCLFTRFPLMMLPLLVMLFKEISTGAVSLWVIKKDRACTQRGLAWKAKYSPALYDSYCAYSMAANSDKTVKRSYHT